jgi:hypothetical protein
MDMRIESISVPIVPNYLIQLEHPTLNVDKIYRFLAKNCSSRQFIDHQAYFARHPAQLRSSLRMSCNATADWAIKTLGNERQQLTDALENVR